MQTEVPTLPVVQSNVHKNLPRKLNPDLRSSTVETKTNSPCKNVTCLSSNKKCLHPLLGGPYRSNIRQPTLLEHSKVNKSGIGQRVLSAKMLRVKELQNQLADAHYRLNELANENRLLRALQKRQDSALKRYEGTNAELPRIIHSHHEELRVVQIKYKKLKALHKETCDALKEKESELQCLQSQNKHLYQLSKDRNLEEREKLQIQVSDLNHKIQQQQETIQVLHRKLSLESKSLKHQLRMEISKRKEIEKNLEKTTEKLKTLENLLDNRERRLYTSGQLVIRNNNGPLGTQSLMNLRDISTSHSLKLFGRDKKWQSDAEKHSLSINNTAEANNDGINKEANCKVDSNETQECIKTETMANLQQIRKYRLQKSSRVHKNSLSDDSEQNTKKLNFKLNDDTEIRDDSGKEENVNKLENENILNRYVTENYGFRKIFENKNFTELTSEHETEFNYSSEDTESDGESRNIKYNYPAEMAKNSRELHARLTNSADEASDTAEDSLMKRDVSYREREKFDKLLARKLVSTNRMYNATTEFSPTHKEKDFYKSDSESELEREVNADYTSDIREDNDFFNLSNEECRKSIDLEPYQVSNKVDYDFLRKSKSSQDLKNEGNAENESHNLQTPVRNENAYEGNKASSLLNNVEYNEEQSGITDQLNGSIKSSQNLEEYLLNRGALNKEKDYDVNMKQSESSDKLHLNELSSKEAEEAVDSTVDSKLPLRMDELSLNDCEKGNYSVKYLSNKSESFNENGVSNVVYKNQNAEANANKLLYNVNAKNKLNKEKLSGKSKARNGSSNDVFEEIHNASTELSNVNERNRETRTINYNKEKLLAKMKAIDNNENIEFVTQDCPRQNVMSRKQITENLFRGLPTQMKTKQDIIKDIFETDSIDSKPKSNCSKLH